jgi:hypothetical protein
MKIETFTTYTTKVYEDIRDILLPKRFCCRKMQELLSMFHYGAKNKGKMHLLMETFDTNIMTYNMFNYWLDSFEYCPFCGEKIELKHNRKER